MREHLGVDVDAMYEEDLMAAEPVTRETEIKAWDPDNEQQSKVEGGVTRVRRTHRVNHIKSMVNDLKEAATQGMIYVG